MKYRINLVVLLLAAMLLPQASIANTEAQSALVSAERLHVEAVITVSGARERVTEAEYTLRLVNAAVDRASRDNDREAMAVASKAKAEAELNLREAEQLLTRAKELLAARVRTVEILRKQAYYRHQPRGLIGGLTWDAGTYVRNLPLTLTPEKLKKANKDLREKLVGAGESIERFCTLKDYNFILGMAVSTNVVVDITQRVLFDQLSKGQATTELQSGYNLLRERSFDELDCHSNGAMICLAALSNGDVKAKKVRLLGPQITPEALQEWNKLLEAGKTGNGIEQLVILINNHDQVPTISFLTPAKISTSGSLTFIASEVAGVVGLGLGVSGISVIEKNLQDAIGNKSVFDLYIDHQIREMIPNATVRRLDCKYGGIYKWAEKCHAIDAYPSP